MTITSSSCAASNVPKMASDTEMWVASSSTRSRAASPSMVSVNNAHRAMASRRAPLSSGMAASKCLLIPTKTAFSTKSPPHRSCLYDRLCEAASVGPASNGARSMPVAPGAPARAPCRRPTDAALHDQPATGARVRDHVRGPDPYLRRRPYQTSIDPAGPEGPSARRRRWSPAVHPVRAQSRTLSDDGLGPGLIRCWQPAAQEGHWPTLARDERPPVHPRIRL